MPIILTLQDTITLAGPASGTNNANQPQNQYLDLSQAQDIWIYTFIGAAAVTGGASLVIQTAPVAEDAAFGIASNLLVTYAAAVATGWQATSGFHLGPPGTGSSTFARYLRWALTGSPTAAYTWSFRILVAVNPISLR